LSLPVRRRLVAVAPHHGSPSSLPERFVAWSNAAHIVVCDDWKPPDEQDLSAFEAAGENVLLTGRDGAVRVCLADDGRPAEVRAWLDRPWR
jgi:hypothetical protein